MSKEVSIKDVYKAVQASLRIIDMSTWELERIRKYIEKHPKAERLPLSLLRRQTELYWFVENLKHNKKGNTNE